MATLTLMLDRRNKNADKFPLVIRIAHKRMPKNIPTGYKLSSGEWSEDKKQIKSPFKNTARANAKVQMKMTLASEAVSECQAILDEMTVYQISDLIIKKIEEAEKERLPVTFESLTSKTTLKDYGGQVIDRYKKAKRFGMAKSFEDAIGMMLKFHGSNDSPIFDINEIFLEDLEAEYVGSDKKLNGLGVRLRAIRRIYNLAIKDKETELTINDYPFGRGGYSIKTERSKKRAVKLDVIEKIRELNYEEGSSLWHHRNYFLFMFNMRGMNFIDLAFLRMDAISEGRLKYKRRKTKRGQNVKEFDIKITPEASRILEYYLKGKEKDDLVFPILEDVIDSDDDLRLYKVYQNRLCNHNRRLITIGNAIGLKEHLTTYVARYTFATAGLHRGVSKAQLGDMLGHTSYYTTEAYFDEFDKEVLDEAAEQILG